MAPVSSIPEICISPAPQEAPPVEPLSPFSAALNWVSSDDDGFRPVHLTPPIMNPLRPPLSRSGGLSPLRPDAPVTGKGLERERFEALLDASRKRNTALGGKKAIDLRKEITLKAHKTKQVERRALFLSKVLASPSHDATLLPKTPPESPAVFHYTLPSPGLESPLAMFESISIEDPFRMSGRDGWIEEVDFRLLDSVRSKQLPKVHTAGDKRRNNPPSLDEITARLRSHGHVATPAESEHTRSSTRRLPAFLLSESRHLGSSEKEIVADPVPVRRRPAPLLLATQVKAAIQPQAPIPSHKITSERSRNPFNPLTLAPLPQDASVDNTPRSSAEISEANLIEFNARARKSQNMLSAIRRRTVIPASAGLEHREQEVEDRKARRNSAPAEPSPRVRSGLEHPVLLMPGGF